MASFPALELHGIAKIFGRTAAVRALDLRLERGDILALLGPNGSGKTTLLKIIAGAMAPTLGDGRILGFDIRRDRVELRSEIGLLAPDTYLYDDLTARENLHFIAVMSGARPEPARIEDILEEVGLLPQAEARVRTFSSGMRRRLGLGRLLLLKPKLLLLDEPYNSLDAAASQLVDDVVRRSAPAGCTTILATHDAERALALAHRVAVLERGALTFSGPVQAYRTSNAQHVG